MSKAEVKEKVERKKKSVGHGTGKSMALKNEVVGERRETIASKKDSAKIKFA